MVTHRCKGSLEAEISIRYTFKFDSIKMENDYKTWRLFKYLFNCDYNCVNQYCVAKVAYCPFCGEKLKGSVEKNDYVGVSKYENITQQQEGIWKKINSELKTVKTECECTKCHRVFIFESKFFDYYDFDGKCPRCYQEDNK